MLHGLYGLPCVSVGRVWRIWQWWGLKTDRELSKWEVMRNWWLHQSSCACSGVEDRQLTVSWERGPCYRGYLLGEGKRRACLRPSINLITCKPALATGKEQRGEALNFILSFREPILKIGSEDPVPTTVPPWRLVLVLRLKLKIKFGGGKTLCWGISGAGVMAQRTSFWFSAPGFVVHSCL